MKIFSFFIKRLPDVNFYGEIPLFVFFSFAAVFSAIFFSKILRWMPTFNSSFFFFSFFYKLLFKRKGNFSYLKLILKFFNFPVFFFFGYLKEIKVKKFKNKFKIKKKKKEADIAFIAIFTLIKERISLFFEISKNKTSFLFYF